MILVKKDYLSVLKIPISEKNFGANKTWRGLLLMPLLVLLGTLVSRLMDQEKYLLGFTHDSWWLFGLGLGLSYVLFELPNSYLKRRMGIAPGKQATSYRPLFIFLDHFDSSLGVGLFYYFIMRIPIVNVVGAVSIGFFVHIIVNYLLYLLKIRREPL